MPLEIDRIVVDADQVWKDARAFLEKNRSNPEWGRFFDDDGKIIGVGTFHPF